MKIIDPHIHLWDPRSHRYPWMDGGGDSFVGDTAPIRRPYLVTDLLADAGSDIQIEAVVHIEGNYDPAEPVEETRWLHALAADPAHRGMPQAIVAGADLSSVDVETVLAAHAGHPNVRGIRQILNVHGNPRYDYVGRHYMHEAVWRSNFRLLARHGLSFDLQIYPSQMPEAVELARAHAQTTIILDHTGMFVDRSSVAGWRAWRDGMRALAQCPNVHAKISGLGMIDHQWTLESLRPYALETIDAFGVERAMFASNFPVDRLYGSYTALWQAYDRIVGGASPTERHALFRGNAERVYRI